MHQRSAPFRKPNFPRIEIIKDITRSHLGGPYLKWSGWTKVRIGVFLDNGDVGYSEKGHVLNQFRCESNAYR